MAAFREITLGGLLRETAASYPEREALVYPATGLRLNYRQFAEECIKTAKGFMALGVAKGDHVSVWTTNLPEWPYLQFGLGMIGAVLVTINTNYKSHDLKVHPAPVRLDDPCLHGGIPRHELLRDDPCVRTGARRGTRAGKPRRRGAAVSP
jgi:non-ribosomal peptide synthetase component E (peptide arylation enzyme)